MNRIEKLIDNGVMLGIVFTFGMFTAYLFLYSDLARQKDESHFRGYIHGKVEGRRQGKQLVLDSLLQVQKSNELDTLSVQIEQIYQQLIRQKRDYPTKSIPDTSDTTNIH